MTPVLFPNGATAAFVQHGRLGRQPLLRGCPVVPGGLAGYAQYIQIFSLIMPPQIANFQLHVCAMEAALADAELRDDPKGILDARNHFAEAISVACQMVEVPISLSALLDEASRDNKGRREAAILTVRALAVKNMLPFTEDHQLERKVIALVEDGLSDQCRHLKLSEKRQTFEKINALNGLHESICQNLRILRELPTTLAEIENVKGDILKAVNKGQCSAYLQPFDWTSLRGKITHICEQISELVVCKDASFKGRFDQVSESWQDLITLASPPTFLNREYVAPFAASVYDALQALKSGAVDRFACAIEPRRKPPLIAEKRYPLHQVGKMLTITVPMVNNGPGVALDVNVELDCGNSNFIALDTDEVRLGDIPPGEFAVSFRTMVVESAIAVDMAMLVSWNQLFGEPMSVALSLRLMGQDPTVDWDGLEQLDPYSLEVADGDRFVGRTAKVQAIGNRLLKVQMSSTYITGQKRIGKTSLAQAVLRYVATHAKPPVVYETFYLEWGEYSAADARGTVKALGEQLYLFLQSHLPREIAVPMPSFEGSLAQLNFIAKALETSRPEKRFVIVLDEFDELHPEMYRFGPLAEAFFANLRTLAARKNLAFILVGGEKMPFIIGAQGDQLNKFGREPLDYFSRSDEWTDYVQLVTGPVKQSLNWEDSALNELFTLTNGHPYYTKLLCAKVFSNAIAQRDTEIIASDIRHAFSGRVSELDTNSFAHFWKDGINAEREEEEVIELKRLRVLVAFGRASRSGSPTRASIADHVSSATLQLADVGPLIDDFCRRDIMNEVGGGIIMQLPIFHQWLQDVGVTKLITSTLADDLENELQKAKDLAYVTATEIESLVKTWPLYRGNQISGEKVRAWLDQVPQPQDQRLLFTILAQLRFVKLPQIGEQLRNAHERVVTKATPPRMRESKVEKRRDLLITYLDGPGKSGATYARAYAKENDLLMESVVEPGKALRRLSSDAESPNALIVVDDLAGTGRSIAESLITLMADLGATIIAKDIPIFIVVLYSTEEAQEKIEVALRGFTGLRSRVHVCSTLSEKDRAFPDDGIGFWKNEQTRDRAKALCLRLGTGLYKDALGFGSQSLLISFPDTCPNNNLPIIFASRSGSNAWNALLPRPAS